MSNQKIMKLTSVDGKKVKFRANDGGGLVKLRTLSFDNVTNIKSCELMSAYINDPTIKEVNFPDLTSVQDRALYNAFVSCDNLTSFSMPKLQQANAGGSAGYIDGPRYGLGSTFEYCKNLISAEFPSLSNVGPYFFGMYRIFRGCTNLKSVSFPALSVIQSSDNIALSPAGWFSYGCQNCSSLTSLEFPVLTAIYYIGLENCCQNCSSLTSFSLPECQTIVSSNVFQSSFYNCVSLRELSFPKLSSIGLNTFNRTLLRCQNVSVHFRADAEEDFSQFSNIQNGMGGTNTTIIYDL